MPGHSRQKDGVAYASLCRAFTTSFLNKTWMDKAWMAGTSPAMTNYNCA